MPLDSLLSYAPSSRASETIKREDYSVLPKLFESHTGQREAWEKDRSTYDVLAVCAGWQAGKSLCAAPWLLREIQLTPDGKDYGAVAPSYPLMNKKLLPELRAVFRGIAKYRPGDRVFVSTKEGLKRLGRTKPFVIHLLHCDDPDAMEAATFSAMIWDEPGQVPDVYWQAAQARVSVMGGKMLLTSRPYYWNWYKREVWDKRNEPGGRIKVVNFRSCDNPAFPMETYLKRKAEMPPWLFSMRYDGVFTRPAGAVYDCFDPAVHYRVPFDVLPDEWEIVIGLDFGLVNMAAVWGVKWLDEKGRSCLHLLGSYLAGNRSPEDHVTHLLGQIKHKLKALKVKKWRIARAVGGSWSEDQWRVQFSSAGLTIERPPYRLVEPGVQCVYRELKLKKLTIDPHLTKLKTDFEEYAFETTDEGDVLDKIKDKATYHRLDCVRYLVSSEYSLTDSEEREANVQRRQGGTLMSTRNGEED